MSVSDAVRAVDTRTFEAQLDDIGELLMTMKGHAQSALSALDRVTECFEVALDVDPSETLVDVRGSAASDTAFITHLHLRQRAQRLERLSRSSDGWLVIGEAASLRRHIIKAMSQVERAVCAELDLTPRLEGNHERELALASRAAYQRYIRAIRTISRRIDGGELDMVSGLRLCATNIAMLFGRDVYKDLRVGDRQQLRSLQDRIFDAVRQPTKDELGIRRLWMDICASAELLERIHDRVELVEHDFALVRTPRGLMTVQTELVGEPAELVTIVDFRGRVLKSWRGRVRIDPEAASTSEQIRSWHRDIELRLRRQLAAVARRRERVSPC